MVVMSNKELMLYGDLDLLILMKYHIVSPEFLQSNFTEEIIKLLPRDYLKHIYRD